MEALLRHLLRRLRGQERDVAGPAVVVRHHRRPRRHGEDRRLALAEEPPDLPLRPAPAGTDPVGEADRHVDGDDRRLPRVGEDGGEIGQRPRRPAAASPSSRRRTTAQPAGQPSTPATQAGSAIAHRLDPDARGRGEEGVLPGRERQLGRAGRKLDEAERGAGRPLERIARRGPAEPMAEIEGGEEIAGAVGRVGDGAVGHQLRTVAA